MMFELFKMFVDLLVHIHVPGDINNIEVWLYPLDENQMIFPFNNIESLQSQDMYREY